MIRRGTQPWPERAHPSRGARFVVWGFALAGAAEIACRGAPSAAPGGSDAAPAPTPTRGAPSLEPPALELPHEAKRIGERAAARDYALVVREVRECPAPAAFPSRPGAVRLGVRLEIEAIGRGDVPVNALHAALVDSTGERHAPAFGGCAPELRAEQLAAGGRASGYVHFELAPSAADLVLEYAPFVLGAGREPVRVRLDR